MKKQGRTVAELIAEYVEIYKNATGEVPTMKIKKGGWIRVNNVITVRPSSLPAMGKRISDMLVK